MLSFEFAGQKYRLEFQRRRKEVELIRKAGKGEHRIKRVTSTHPYTTARLLLMREGETPRKFAEATVGCYTHDRYEPELGRRCALMALRRKIRAAGLEKETLRNLMKSIWFHYLNRAELQGKPKEPTTQAIVH